MNRTAHHGLGRAYNRTSSVFRHELAAHPLFSLTALTRLAMRCAAIPKNVYHSNGHIDPHDPWAKGTPPGVSLSSSLANIDAGNSLIILKGVEQDGEYAATVQDLMKMIMAECGPTMASDVIRSRATIFLASPHRVTTFHMDADTNFLFQLHGSKDFYVYPHARTFRPEVEMERYFAGDSNAISYSRERRGLERHYCLDSQSALHVPILFPHWAKNRESVSIALSINFDLRSMEAQAQLYRMNSRLRRFGLSPGAPGRSALVDSTKLSVSRLGRMLRRGWVAHRNDRLVSTT